MKKPILDARIGIDGGGTSCRFALQLGTLRYDLTAPGYNVHTDFDLAISALRKGLEALAEQSGMPFEVLTSIPIYAGLAGATVAATCAAVVEAMPLDFLVVEDDRRCAVVGALGSSDGAVMCVGTGSFAAGQRDGSVRLLGGYGGVLGDEASGCWLGRRLLSRALHCLDGLAQASDLTDQAWDHFDGDLGAMLRFGQTAKPSDFAQFAPWVVAAASAGDRNGLALMQEGAAQIERYIDVLGWQDGEPLCLLGGIGAAYRDFLAERFNVGVRAPLGSAVDGALEIAGRLEATDMVVMA